MRRNGRELEEEWRDGGRRERTGYTVFDRGGMHACLHYHSCCSLHGWWILSIEQEGEKKEREEGKEEGRRSVAEKDRGNGNCNTKSLNHVLCAANSNASLLGKPIMTPPSAIASKTKQTKAGPDPHTAVTASKC